MYINSFAIPVVDSVRDLGVIVDSKLTFVSHIDQVVARAFVRTNLILKCFISRDIKTLVRAFTVYVRPIVEYASCVWSPYHVCDVTRVESVQRSFTKRLPGYCDTDYKSRLLLLGLDSLELRRLRQDLIFTYKILFGLTSDVASDFFIVSNSEHDTRGHSYKLYPRFNRIDLRKYFFTERIIGPWNSLPATEENFECLSKFKLFINSVDLSKHVSF
jgi:hypothetical protein